jgi:hypothetical protein
MVTAVKPTRSRQRSLLRRAEGVGDLSINDEAAN